MLVCFCLIFFSGANNLPTRKGQDKQYEEFIVWINNIDEEEIEALASASDLAGGITLHMLKEYEDAVLEMGWFSGHLWS